MPRLRHSASRIIVVLALLFALSALALAAGGAAAAGAPGAVYTLSNASDGNQLLVFDRNADGSLTFAGSVDAGGTGNGGALGSQGAVVISEDGHWLFAVNAGSNQISVFRLSIFGPVLVNVVGSGGMMPISLTQHGRLLYVLNAGGSGNITGFRINPLGRLLPIPNSTRPLSGSNAGPAQVSFTADGQSLVVTEKNTNMVDTYQVGTNGRATGPNTQPSNGAVPFGFAIDSHNHLIVSEAGPGTLSSYQVDADGMLHSISASVTDHQAAPCWVVLSGDEQFAYTTNAASNSISGYRVGSDGSLALLDMNGVTATTGGHPTDMATSRDGQFLYTVNNTDQTISAFQIMTDGHLTPVTGASGLPASTVGLAGR